jgi:hypothetical protein
MSPCCCSQGHDRQLQQLVLQHIRLHAVQLVQAIPTDIPVLPVLLRKIVSY